MATTAGVIGVVVAVAGLGVTAQGPADRLQVPSVLCLLSTGVLVGPEVFGIVTPSGLVGFSGIASPPVAATEGV